MKIERTATLTCSRKDAESLMKEYFESAGYTWADGSYQRGTQIGSIFGMNPRSWEAEVSWKWTTDGLLEIQWDIYDTFQFITRQDAEFWRIEADGVLQVLQGDPLPSQEDRSGQKSVKQGWIIVLVVILVPLIRFLWHLFAAQ